MEKKTVIAPEGVFRSKLLPAALGFGILAAVCGIFPVLALADPAYRQLLIRKLLTSGIASRSALNTWSVINGTISLLCAVCPGLLAVGLAAALRGKPAQGFGFLSAVGTWGLRMVNGIGVFLAGLYVFRMVRYVVLNLGTPQAVMSIYSMLLMEGMMGALAWGLFVCVRRFVEGFGDAMASMAYTLSSGRIDSVSVPAAAERGFLVLGIVCPVWAVSQTVTMTVVANHIRSYYSFVFASHPMEWLTAASLVCNGVVGILMWLYLRRYNRICEWEKFQAGKKK